MPALKHAVEKHMPEGMQHGTAKAMFNIVFRGQMLTFRLNDRVVADAALRAVIDEADDAHVMWKD